MASARVYRHAVRGPDCGAHRMRRDGYPGAAHGFTSAATVRVVR